MRKEVVFFEKYSVSKMSNYESETKSRNHLGMTNSTFGKKRTNNLITIKILGIDKFPVCEKVKMHA